MVLLQDRQDGNAGVLKGLGTPEKEVKKFNLRQWIPTVFFHSMCSITPVAHLKKYTVRFEIVESDAIQYYFFGSPIQPISTSKGFIRHKYTKAKQKHACYIPLA